MWQALSATGLNVPFRAAYRHFTLVTGAYTSLLPALPNDNSRVLLDTGVEATWW